MNDKLSKTYNFPGNHLESIVVISIINKVNKYKIKKYIDTEKTLQDATIQAHINDIKINSVE